MICLECKTRRADVIHPFLLAIHFFTPFSMSIILQFLFYPSRMSVGKTLTPVAGFLAAAATASYVFMILTVVVVF